MNDHFEYKKLQNLKEVKTLINLLSFKISTSANRENKIDPHKTNSGEKIRSILIQLKH